MSKREQQIAGRPLGRSRGPISAFARNTLIRANEEIHRGQLVEAEKLIREVLAAEPDDFLANHLLGAVMLDVGKFAEAKRFLEKALEIEPGHLGAKFKLGLTELSLLAFDRAEMCFRAIVEQDSENYRAHLQLANTFHAQGRDDDAGDQYLRAIQLRPESADAWAGLGEHYQYIGRTDEAVECLEKTLDIDPTNTRTRLNLALSDYFLTRPDEIANMEKLFTNDALSENQRSQLAFALARTFDGQKKFDAAFEYYSQGNRLRNHAQPYTIKLAEEHFRKLRKVFSTEYIEQHSMNRESKLTPVFIVGMPRSGTTLVEQILSCHPDVHAGGELVILPKLCERLVSFLNRLEKEDFRDLGLSYLIQLRRESDRAEFITDKLPGNFEYIGFIRLALPHAKIIHCRRNPLDNCVSIFRNNFFDANGPFDDQKKLGKYYRLYEELMAHWRRVAPAAMHEVSYEDLVADTESEVRSLLTYCGLSFDPACMKFHKNARSVRTISHDQVKQPIYSDSVSSWKRYERHLNPLKEALGYPRKTEGP